MSFRILIIQLLLFVCLCAAVKAEEVSDQPIKEVSFQNPRESDSEQISETDQAGSLRVYVNKDGEVSNVIIIRSLDTNYDEDVKKAALKLQFKPGKSGETPLEVWVNLPYWLKDAPVPKKPSS